MNNKERFIDIFKQYIKREGSDKLLEYLISPKCDFFEAPASTRFHGSYDGGLVEHSLNVYDCLKDYLSRDTVKNKYGLSYSEESIAIVALLHDMCKIDCYKKGTRNVKENGQWIQVPTYEYN
ncbi:MAG: hydrolase, partial [Coprobacillus sp.]